MGVLESGIEESHRNKEGEDEKGWNYEVGILLSRREAVAIHRLLMEQELGVKIERG